jgi:hypothetical protein
MPCAGFVLGAWWFRGFSLEAPEAPVVAPRAVKAPIS